MEHIIGIIAHDTLIHDVGFMTWGRLFDRVDPQSVIDTLKDYLSKFGINNAKSIEVCNSLQETSHYLYFYEGLFELCQEIIPATADEYTKWKDQKLQSMKNGEWFYFLGIPN